MEKGFSSNTLKLIILGAILSGCLPVQQGSISEREFSIISNTPDSVDYSYGRVIAENAVAQTGDTTLSKSEDMAKYLQKAQVYITDEQFLIHDCREGKTGEVKSCLKVLDEQSADNLQNTDRKWAYTVHSDEFYQVQGFYHLRKVVDIYQNTLDYIYGLTNNVFSPNNYDSAISSSLFSANANWYPDRQLVAYTDCGVEDNAYYNPSTFTLCFGEVKDYPQQKFVFDPSIIYHEIGHAFTQMTMNSRNVASSIPTRVDLGALSYDEAGAINEAISDFWSYYITGRRHIGEWALAIFYKQSRPLSEDDDLHAPGIGTDADSRLEYPTYVNYDPNDLNNKVEAVHYTGQIASHFFSALTDELIDYCSMTEDAAKKYVMYFILETLAETGDMSTRATDGGTLGNINLTMAASQEWINTVNPPNFHTFFQRFTKYAYGVLDKDKRCNGVSYPLSRLESLLDSYGLLLFNTLNEDGNSVATGHSGSNTTINEINRINTVLVSKDHLILDNRTNAVEAYIFDKREDIIDAIATMKQSGQITEISPILSEDAIYNNNNIRISPGEIVGVALNLYNDSNSTMGGVQLLANDWDHMKVTEWMDDEDNNTKVILDQKPCGTFSDGFPRSEEGAIVETTSNQGDCNYITRENGAETVTTAGPDNMTGTADDLTYSPDPLAPICMVQMTENGASIWAPQWKLMKEQGLPSTKCLSGSTNTSDCFVRAIKGADQAVYSKLEAGKNWAETITKGEGKPKFNYSNLIFLEVSPYIPPGTVFNCRFRARFSNCKDCYYDSDNSDNYLDYEYSGAKPFQIINFKFWVTD